MRCLVFAYSEIGAVAFETLEQLGEEIVGLVTHEDNPDEVRWWRSVGEMAETKNVPVITYEDPNAPEIVAWGRQLRPDVIFSFYYRRMLKKPWLEMAPLGAFNLHGSLLPKFRGRAPVNWAIIEGATETGLTLHEMVERPDAGQILDQASVPILENDTAQRVFEKLVPLTRVILQRTVPLLRDGRAPRRPQDEAEASYFGKRTPEDGEMGWHWPVRRVHNLVRGLTKPYPGAFGFIDGKKIFVWKGHIATESLPSTIPGTVLSLGAGAVAVVCGEGSYCVEEVQQEGAEVQSGASFLKPGTIFDSYNTGE